MKIREAAKSAALVLLILSTMAMTARLWNMDERLNTGSGVFQSLSGLMDRVGLSGLLERLRGASEPDDGVTYADRLVSPARVLIREEGRLFLLDFAGGQQMAQTLEPVYPVLDGCLLSDASRLTGESAQREWKQALLSDGVVLDLGRSVPYPVFAGQTADSNAQLSKVSLRHLVLTDVQPQGVRCVIKDTVTGDVYLFETDQSADAVGAALPLLREEAAALPAALVADGFPQGGYPDGLFLGLTLAPEILVLPDASVPALAASNPVYPEDGAYNIELIYELLDIFEYNPKAKSFNDAGAVTYVENFSSIRIETDGWLHYKANQAAGGIPVASLIGTQKESYSGYEMVMAAIRFIGQFDGSMAGGDASLRFSGVSYDEQSKTVAVDFVYTSGGICIGREEDYAARVTFEAGYLRYVDILLRSYRSSDTVVEEIGFLKALELLKTSSDRSALSLDTFELRYEDNGGDAPIRPQYEGRTRGGDVG